MATITSSIDIAASPSVVRQKFLDFPSLPKYHSSFFTSLTPLGPLEPGSKVRVVFSSGQKMDATINYNTEKAFAWTGSIPLLFTGTHSFYFEPSTAIPGGTMFIQEEVFSGALGFLMGENIVAKQMGFSEKTRKGWEGYNKDIKGWCESQ